MDDADRAMARAVRMAATEQHLAAARHHAVELVERARRLRRNGILLADAERMSAFIAGEVPGAIAGAKVAGCHGCQGAAGPAAVALIGALTQLALDAGR